MIDLEREITAILTRARSGEEESALAALCQLPGEIVPLLHNVFNHETDAPTRALIVNAAWQRREAGAILLLRDGLRDAHEQVWQESLNGLVALGSGEALEVLRLGSERRFADESERRRFQLWLDEAILYLDNARR